MNDTDKLLGNLLLPAARTEARNSLYCNDVLVHSVITLCVANKIYDTETQDRICMIILANTLRRSRERAGSIEHFRENGMPVPTLTERIRSLIHPQITDLEHDCTADEVAGAICDLLSEAILKDDNEGDKLCDWEQEIRSLRCKLLGEHQWTIDNCGYWGHQYCLCCNEGKYQRLAGLTISEAKECIGDITELQYQHIQALTTQEP